jgi:hypothetical protein
VVAAQVGHLLELVVLVIHHLLLHLKVVLAGLLHQMDLMVAVAVVVVLLLLVVLLLVLMALEETVEAEQHRLLLAHLQLMPVVGVAVLVVV